MPSAYSERLEKAISKYEEGVNQTLRRLRRVFFLDILTIGVVPIILVIIAYIWSGIGGFLTTLGLGGLNAGDRFVRGQTILKTYFNEKSKLEFSLSKLKMELALCDANDTTCLQGVEQLLRKYIDILSKV